MHKVRAGDGLLSRRRVPREATPGSSGPGGCRDCKFARHVLGAGQAEQPVPRTVFHISDENILTRDAQPGILGHDPARRAFGQVLEVVALPAVQELPRPTRPIPPSVRLPYTGLWVNMFKW